MASIQESTSAPGRFVPQRPGQAQLRLITFNFPSIQETAEKPNEQQQQARRFPSLQEEALSLVILTTSFFRDKRRKPLRFASWFPAYRVFSQLPKCLHQAM